MQWCAAALLGLAACGRVGFDATTDARAVPDGLRLWLELETDPSEGIVDSARGHAVACNGPCPIRAAGQIGAGYVFDGQQLDVTYAPDLAVTGAFTIAVWARLDVYPVDYACTFTKPIATTDFNSFAVCVEGTNHTAYANTDTATQRHELIGPTMPLGTWHHLAMTWDTATRIFYFDGTERARDSVTLAGDANDLRVGADNGNSLPVAFPWAGGLDDIRFYDRALPGEAIAALASP